MDRNWALDALFATELGAVRAARHCGRGNAMLLDQSAVDGWAIGLANVPICGVMKNNEGIKDGAPMIENGAHVGLWREGIDPLVDIVGDAVDCTKRSADDDVGGISCLAFSEPDGFLDAPMVMYCQKLAVGPKARGAVSINWNPTRNLHAVAEALGKRVSDLRVAVLERPRHNALVEEIRAAGARVKPIRDGDVIGAMATSFPQSRIDAYMGIGGLSEALLAAAGQRCTGGDFQMKLHLERPNENLVAAAVHSTGRRFDHAYRIDEIARGNVMFLASCVTDSLLLKLHGVQFYRSNDEDEEERGAIVQSLVMRSASGSRRIITTDRATWP